MPKPKSKSKPVDQSKQVYSRVNHLERDIGSTRAAPGECLYAQTNARPLEAFIPKSQLRTTERHEWAKTNKVTVHHDPVNVLEHAQRHISRLKLGNPATSGERQRYREAEIAATAKGSGGKNSLGSCVPTCCDGNWGKPGSPAPPSLSGGSKRKY